jgi:hypothetical protein
MKICGRCFKLKPTSDFSFKNKKLEKRSTYCKECNRAYQKWHYKVNRAIYLRNRDLYHRKIDTENQQKMIQYLSSHPCVDCGEADLRVLEFDHIKVKHRNISRMFADSFRWEKILAEILYCEVRCANCHKRRTAKQFNWYKPRSAP